MRIGKYCEKYKIKIAYKPLSERMVEDPFWFRFDCRASCTLFYQSSLFAKEKVR